MFVFLNVMVAEGPPNNVVTHRNGFDAFFLSNGMIRATFLEGLVTRSCSVIVSARAGIRVAINKVLLRLCRRVVVVVTSELILSPGEDPDLVRDKDFLVSSTGVNGRILTVLAALNRLVARATELSGNLTLVNRAVNERDTVRNRIRLSLSIEEDGISDVYQSTGDRRGTYRRGRFFRVVSFLIYGVRCGVARISGIIRMQTRSPGIRLQGFDGVAVLLNVAEVLVRFLIRIRRNVES